MGRRCCIPGCNSRSSAPEHHGVTYHSYPLDASTRALWIRNTRLSSDRNITKSVLVCSRHFRRADFQPMKSGKYLLKQRVFPTVFPWGKLDVNALNEEMAAATPSIAAATVEAKTTKAKAQVEDELAHTTASTETASPASVEAKVAQIMAEAAELNAQSRGIKTPKDAMEVDTVTTKAGKRTTNEPMTDDEPASKQPCNAVDASMGGPGSPGVKFEPVTVFNPGVRLEAQDFDGIWHLARVVEVDNDDREVLIKFEKNAKNKSLGSEEWIPMNSTRLRQKVSTKPIPIFELEDKVMARWSGPRRFPGTVKKILENDSYEVLFDDGFVKNVRAIHMNRVHSATDLAAPSPLDQKPVTPSSSSNSSTPAKGLLKVKRLPLTEHTPPSGHKSKRGIGQRKDWPLLQMDKLDLASLNLPNIPKDGEWTCHWVNDQPIGKEGFLIVGEHKKPTVIVDDWRLPQGWIKHMYQRSNVLGKWDVILVSPQGKRFRSKADLKTHLEDQGRVYNPDIYDFSIHRRRAKDINAYVYTADYVPQHHKPKSADTSMNASLTDKETKSVKPTTVADKPQVTSTPLVSASLKSPSTSHYIEPPEVTPVPPMELMTSPTIPKQQLLSVADAAFEAGESTPVASSADNGFAYIGGLKVQIVDNLFRCPQEGCSKNFRKENHLQIHVKHYHQDLIKLLGTCPKMQELAEKRTLGTPDLNEPAPKNQIPNQQFFAKLHQQDLEQSRSHRRTLGTLAQTATVATTTTTIAAALTSTKTATAAAAAATALETQKENELIKDRSDEEVSTVRKIKATAGDVADDLTREEKTGETKMEKQGGNLSLDAFNMNATVTDISQTNTTADSSMLEVSATSSAADESIAEFNSSATVGLPPKRARFSPHKRPAGARKSNRQRTTRRYLTAAQATAGAPHHPPVVTADSANNGFGADDFEETRHSFNATPDARTSDAAPPSKKRKPPPAAVAPATPLSSLDSPVTADSGSSSFLPLPEDSLNNSGILATPQYIKENGELIKIVRMRQEEIINCLCSYGEEDGLMIQCELCLCWQHGSCNGIEKESDVPDKYVCYICRNPQRGRESMRYKHDQDWLYEGKLPVANYHNSNPDHSHRFDMLKKSHTLSGNLVELKRFMHSLQVKINVANNKCHPKMYLWAKKWDEEEIKTEECKADESGETTIKAESEDGETICEAGQMNSSPKQNEQTKPKAESDSAADARVEHIKTEPLAVEKVSTPLPIIPQPEAAIEPVECQHRLLEHIKIQQNRLMERLLKIETEIDDLEKLDALTDLKDADLSTTKDVISSFIKELDIMKQISKVNALENSKQAMAADHSILIKS